MKASIRKNLTQIIVLASLAGLFVAAASGMESEDFYITLLRGLSVGAVTFLVASGFSLIFGLLDVLNLAHGTLFMIGAYVGWTVYVRPDTFIDLLTPFAIILSGFLLKDVWGNISKRLPTEGRLRKLLPWIGILFSVVILIVGFRNYPIAMWNFEDYSQTPVSISYLASQGLNVLSPAATFENSSPLLVFPSLILGSLLLSLSLSLFSPGQQIVSTKLSWRSFIGFGVVFIAGVLVYVFNDALTIFLAGLSTNWLFMIAVLIAVLSGAGLGAMMETSLIRPLYIRPIYQLMLTLGLSAIGIEMVRAIWGRPEFTMPRPELFAGTGEGCPATSLSGWWQNHCSTMIFMDGRIRIYNEFLIPIIGVVVLVAVWILLQRSRLGMVIRAGVQDREMVEALGINVRRVFTQVFALGVGLAALGGVLAAPSTGLSNAMGESFFLNALIALAIGGLTSYPGAALGSLVVGLLQQFIIKYGQIGIPIPFTDAVFKPSPPIVPASTILLMVIILLILPNGLLGRKE
jgi:branched-chain amino acid transport system permease protein